MTQESHAPKVEPTGPQLDSVSGPTTGVSTPSPEVRPLATDMATVRGLADMYRGVADAMGQARIAA